jgi:hypothetical protein
MVEAVMAEVTMATEAMAMEAEAVAMEAEAVAMEVEAVAMEVAVVAMEVVATAAEEVVEAMEEVAMVDRLRAGSRLLWQVVVAIAWEASSSIMVAGRVVTEVATTLMPTMPLLSNSSRLMALPKPTVTRTTMAGSKLRANRQPGLAILQLLAMDRWPQLMVAVPTVEVSYFFIQLIDNI